MRDRIRLLDARF